jgi:hypothetical protein
LRPFVFTAVGILAGVLYSERPFPEIYMAIGIQL